MKILIVQSGVAFDMLEGLIPKTLDDWLQNHLHGKQYAGALVMFRSYISKGIDRGTALHRSASTYGLADREFDKVLVKAGL
jgi:hypothetical protein